MVTRSMRLRTALLRLDLRALHDVAHALQAVLRPLRDHFGLRADRLEARSGHAVDAGRPEAHARHRAAREDPGGVAPFSTASTSSPSAFRISVSGSTPTRGSASTSTRAA